MTSSYTTEHVGFLTKDGLELPGLLFAPQVQTKKIAIFLHGNGSSSIFYKPTKMNILAKLFSDSGWAFLPFNNRGAHYIKKFRRYPEKKEEVMLGTWMEKITESEWDIQAAVEFAQSRGYEDIILIGESSGANKICVYHAHQPQNPVKGYALVGGGDDTGIWYQMLGEEYVSALESGRHMIARGRGEELTETRVTHHTLSYQSLIDTIDPDGEYNVFPYLEASSPIELSTQPLFHAFSQLDKPTLALYGELDTFCVVKPHQAVEILREFSAHPQLLTGKVVPQADHSFEGKEHEEAQAILEWLRESSLM